MKTITKFIYFGFASLALAYGSIAFAQVQFAPVTPASSAAKAAAQFAAQGPASVSETVEFESGSRWHLTVDAVKQFGLVITGASFQKPGSPSLYVLNDGRLAALFVPYHPGSPRFEDIFLNFDPLKLPAAKFPAPRHIIGGGYICKEVRDYLAYIDAFTDRPNTRVRYGQEVVYFSVLDAANYQYIEEWTFRDDGAILVRAGSTGPKHGGPDDMRGHMHNFTWRLDIDLNGADENSAYLTSHLEDLTVSPSPVPSPSSGVYRSASTADDTKDLISVEGSREWNPRNFNTLEIFDRTLQNGRGDPTSYELVPMRTGTARHSEPFTKKDFWVTVYNPAEILAAYLPSYIRDEQRTVNEDLVIWYTGSAHHEDNPRDEDRNTVPVIWTGFELLPKNLFDNTPFYPNP